MKAVQSFEPAKGFLAIAKLKAAKPMAMFFLFLVAMACTDQEQIEGSEKDKITKDSSEVAPQSTDTLKPKADSLENVPMNGSNSDLKPKDIQKAKYNAVLTENTGIISLNPAISEFLAMHGFGRHIVARDASTTYPAFLLQAPSLGPPQSVTSAALFAYDPDIIIGLERELNPEEMTKVKQAKGAPKLLLLSLTPTKESLLAFYKQLGKMLDLETEAEEMAKEMTKTFASIVEPKEKKTVMFLYAMDRRTIMTAGKGTAIDAMINFANAENAIQQEGYAPYDPKLVFATQPDVILMFEESLAALGGMGGLSEVKGLAASKAVQANRVFALNAYYLSGFGPRTAQAAKELNTLIYRKAGA